MAGRLGRLGTTCEQQATEQEPAKLPIISVDKVSHHFYTDGGSVEALRDVSLQVERDSFSSIVGSSGCGKTTILTMIAGLLSPESGAVQYSGKTITRANPDDIGLVFQDASLLPWKNALDNVLFPARLKKLDKRASKVRATELLELVGLRGFERAYPHELSGGMAQRVAIARGLMQSPNVLLMDEPFGALDEQTRISMGEELLRIWTETKTTIIFVTHSLHEAVFLSERVVVMAPSPGRVVGNVTIDLPRPRNYDLTLTPEFTDYLKQIRFQMKDQEELRGRQKGDSR